MVGAGNDKFWVLTLIPWLVMLACSRPGAAGSTGWWPIGDRLVYRGGLPLLAGGILLCNVLSGILPDSTPNPAMQNALSAWTQRSKPHDVLIPSTELVPHLHFWENRPGTLILYRTLQQAPTDDRFSVLRATIDAAIERKADVLYAPARSTTCVMTSWPFCRSLANGCATRWHATTSRRYSRMPTCTPADNSRCTG